MSGQSTEPNKAYADGVEITPHAEVRIRFGPKPHQTLSLPHAEAMLTALAKDAPSTFGLYLRKVIMAELNGARP